MSKKRKRQYQARQKGRMIEIGRLTEELKNLKQFTMATIELQNIHDQYLEDIQGSKERLVK